MMDNRQSRPPSRIDPLDRLLRRPRDRRGFSDQRASEDLMRDWYGEKRAALEIESSQPPASQLNELLDTVVYAMDREHFLLLRRIVDRWQNLVGPVVCHSALPRKIIGNVLYIEVIDSAWLFHLERNFKADIQKAVRSLTKDRVEEIRFVPGGRSKRL